MKHHFAAALTAAALLIGGPAGAQSRPTPAATRTAVVTCDRAHLYVFNHADNRPTPISRERDVRQGMTFAIVSGPRTTLESVEYYETAIPVIENGPDLLPHYYLQQGCINLSG